MVKEETFFETFFHKIKKSIWQKNMTRSRKMVFLPTEWKSFDMCSVKEEEIKIMETNIGKVLLLWVIKVIYLLCDWVNLIFGENGMKRIQMFPTSRRCSSMLFYVPWVGRHSMKVSICKVLTTIRRTIICLLHCINISISFRIGHWLFCTMSRIWGLFSTVLTSKSLKLTIP